jgi:hypothetical protein
LVVKLAGCSVEWTAVLLAAWKAGRRAEKLAACSAATLAAEWVDLRELRWVDRRVAHLVVQWVMLKVAQTAGLLAGGLVDKKAAKTAAWKAGRTAGRLEWTRVATWVDSSAAMKAVHWDEL